MYILLATLMKFLKVSKESMKRQNKRLWPMKAIAQVALLVFFAEVITGAANAQSGNPPLYEPGIVYLRIRDTSSVSIRFDSLHLNTEPAVLNPVFSQFQVYDVQTPFAILGSSFARCYRIFHNTVGQEDSLINVLRLLPFVEFAERMPHDVLDADCPNMPANPQGNYYMASVNACQAFDLHNWNNHPNAPRTLVAVVDDAVMTNHEDLEMHMAGGWDVAHNDADANPPFNTPFGNLGFFEHGTRVASVVGGDAENTLGVSSMGWFNDVMPVKCQHDAAGQPGAPGIAFYDGLAWASAHGAQVINMSWGNYAPSQMNYNVIVAASGGTILVSTAGNHNIVNARYPGAYGEGATGQTWEALNSNLVLSVANLASNGNKGPTSNFGPWVDVSSYGVGIRMADIPHNGNAALNNQYVTDSGTSFSAPQVSALAGLMWSYMPNASAGQVINCILGTANPDIYDAAHPGNQPGTLGSGRIDAYAALLCLAQTCTPPPVASITPSNLYVCPNGSTALTANPGIAYQWTTGATTPSITVTQAGTYSVTVTFQIGPVTCTGTGQITIAATPVTVPVIETGTHCASASNEKRVTIGAPASTYLWSINGGAPFSGGNTYAVNSNAGYTYAVTMTDVWGCAGLTETIGGDFEQHPPVEVTITATENSAIPNDGIICGPAPVTLTASGGITYEWAAGLGTNASINVTPTANTLYAVTVTDDNGCTAASTYTVQVIPNFVGLQVTENSGMPNDRWLCEPGATVTIAAVGCPGNTFTYLWNTGETTASITRNPTVGTEYRVTVTDLSGATQVRDVYIFVVDGNTVSLTVEETSNIPNDAIICQGSSALLSAFPTGMQYLWSTGQTSSSLTVSPSATTAYTVTVTINLCSYTRTRAITVIPTPTAAVAVTENSGTPNDGIICQGTSVILSASSNTAGAAYQWSHNLGSNPVVSVTPVDPVTTYQVTVTSPNGCTAVASFAVSIGSSLSVSEASGIPNDGILCTAGATAVINATAAPGTVYLWSTGANTPSITVTPLTTTTYTVTTTNGGGCTGVQSVTLTVNAPNIVLSVVENSGIPNDGIVCSGTSAMIQATAIPGATYLWSTLATTPQITVSPIVTQNYTVTVTVGNGCTHVRTQTITVTPSPFVVIEATENSGIPNDGILCPGFAGPVVLTANATQGVTYLWSTGATTQTVTVSPNQTTAYSVTVTSANGCVGSSVLNIIVGVNLTLIEGNPPVPSDGIICQGTEVIITANGGSGATYNWSNGATNAPSITVSPTITTTYTVTATDAIGGCTSTASTTITVVQPNPNLSMSFSENSGTPNDGIVCPNSTVVLWVNNPQPNYTYLWNTGETTDQITVAPTLTQAYQVTVTIGNACTRVLSRFINVIPHAPVDIAVTENSGTPNDRTICLGAQAVLTASNFPGETYQWSNGAGNTQTVTVSPTATTTYTVSVTNPSSGCVTTGTATITVDPPANVTVTETSDVPNDGTICAGDQAVLTAGNIPGATYQWSNGLGNSTTVTVSPLATTTYTVTVTTAGGCLSTATATITVNLCAPLCACLPGGYNIVGEVRLSLLSPPMPALLEKSCLYVRGKLIVDDPLTLIGCEIILDEGAEIEVVEGNVLTLDDNTIRGCDRLWRSITVHDGSTLVATGNEVSDGLYAIFAEATATLTITGNIFDRNFLDVYVPPAAVGSLHNVQLTGPLQGNQFLCTAALLPPYVGQTPTSGNFTFAGVFVHDVVGWFIDPSNTFNGLRNGVVALRSNLTMTGGNINNLVHEATPVIPPFGPNQWDQVGVLADNCALASVSNCMMAGVRMGIFGRQTNFTAEGNNITTLASPLSVGILATQGINRTTTIRQNTVRAGQFGILVTLCSNIALQQVEGNTVSLLPQVAETGIYLYGTRRFRLRENTVRNTNANNPFVGINLWDSHDNQVTNNRLYDLQRGLWLTATNNNYLYENEARRDPANPLPVGNARQGFAAFTSKDIFCCNTVDELAENGFSFSGACEPTSFRQSNIGRCGGTGLSIAATNTAIGEQTHAGNVWEGASSYGTGFGAMHGSSVPSQILKSQFRCEAALIPTWTTGAGQSVKWFEQILGSAPTVCGSCPNLPNFTNDDTDDRRSSGDAATAQGGHQMGPNSGAFNWEMQRSLYDRLRNDATAVANGDAGILSFYNTAASQPVGRFSTVAANLKTLIERGVSDRAEMNALTESIRSRSVALRQAMMNNPAQRGAIFQDLCQETAAYQAKVAQISTAQQSEIPALLSENNSIPADSIYKTNERTLNRLMLEHRLWEIQEPSAAVLAEVKAIADQCPVSGGKVVYQARGLYKMFRPESVGWGDDWEACGGERSQTLTKQTSDQEYTFAPNPAMNSVILTSMHESAADRVLTLYGPTGTRTYTRILPALEMTWQIETAQWPAGLYFFKIEGAGKIQSGKLIIRH